MILGDKQSTSFVLSIDGAKINNSREIEMLGNVIDNQLKFSTHIKWLVYSEYHKSFEELFQINKNISIHQKHYVLEVHKSIMNPEFMWHCFNTNPIPYTVKPVYCGHLAFLKKVSATVRCLLYRCFQVILMGNKFCEFRVFWTILHKLVLAKVIDNSLNDKSRSLTKFKI